MARRTKQLATEDHGDKPRGSLAASEPATPKAIVPLMPYQQARMQSTARFTHNNWSRQTGKSFVSSLKRMTRGLERKRNQIFLSASKAQSLELMLKTRQHVEALGIGCKWLDSNYFEDTDIKQLEIAFTSGVRIIGLPANPRTARGFTGDVLLDEFAMHQGDRAIWAALFPTVLRGAGELDIYSTPKGKDNIFAKLAENPEFEHSLVTIYDAVRDGLEADPEQLRRAVDDEQIWRQEFMCEYLDESTAFLTYEQIAACEEHGLAEPIVVDGREHSHIVAAQGRIAELRRPDAETRGHGEGASEYFVGYDVARKRDLAVIWVWEKVGDVLTTRLVLEISNCPFRMQYELLATLIEVAKVSGVAIDATGMGMPIAEKAVEDYGAHRVDAVTFTQEAKMKLAEQLRVKVEDRNVRIPATVAIRNDWHSIEKSVTTGGTIRYHADRNKYGHADRFWAAALGVDAAFVEGHPWRGECRGTRQTRGRGDAGTRREQEKDREEREEERQRKRMRRHRMAGVW